MAGAGAFGPAGIAGGSYMDMDQRMSFAQSAFTAWGENIPGFGRYAGQRLSMTREQATQMAQEDVTYGALGGAKRAGMAAANVLTLGTLNFQLRRSGLLFQKVHSERFAKHIQNQFRFVSRENLEKSGLGEYAGAFSTGITRGGATALAASIAPSLSGLESEMGLAPEEIMTLQSRATGLMGSQAISRLVGSGGGKDAVGARLGSVMGKGVRSVVDIQQTLNLSEKEAEEFFKTIGQMYGTADRVARMAKQAQSHATQWNMNKRQVFEMMRGFEDVGRTMAIGQGATRNIGMDYVGALRAQTARGLMTREELMRYAAPGATEEEALQAQVMNRFQRGVGMYQSGQLGGSMVLATQNRGAFMKLMTGGLDPMEFAGEVGRTYAEDPWAGLKTRYDANAMRTAGRLGDLVQFQRVAAKRRGGYFLTEDRVADIAEFESLTGLNAMDSRTEYNRYLREAGMFGRVAGRKFGKGDNKQRGNDIQLLFHRLQAEGLTGMAKQMFGGDIYDAATSFYGTLTNGGKSSFDANMDLEEALLLRSSDKAVSVSDITSEMNKGLFSQIASNMKRQPGKFLTAFGDPDVTFARGNTSKNLGKFLSPLASRGASGRDLNRLIFGQGVGAEGMRMMIDNSDNPLMNVAVQANGLFRVMYQGKTREDVSLRNISSAAEDLAGSSAASGGTAIGTIVEDAIAKSMSGLSSGGLDKFVGDLQQTGGITGHARRAYEKLVFGRYKGFSDSVFGGSVTSLSGMTTRAANAERDDKTMETLFRLGATGVQAFAKAFDTTSGGFRLQGGLDRVTDIFGSEGEAIPEIRKALERANVPGWDAARIEKALGQKSSGSDRMALRQALVGREVVQEIMGSVLKAQNAEKMTEPLGSPGNPMVVRPDVGTWNSSVIKKQGE